MAKKTGSKKSATKAPSIKKLSYKTTIKLVTVLAVIILGAGVVLWYKNIFMNPQRVFYGMLNNSLHTTSITREISSMGATQTVRINYYSEPFTITKTEMTQPGQHGENSVTTQTIGTKNADFVRYIKLTTNGQPTPGADNVINTWASQSSENSLMQKPTFLNEISLALVPFGNLNNQDTQKITDIARSKHVYSINGSQKRIVNNRLAFVFDVSVKPSSLIEMLKTYSEVTGLGDTSQLNPKDYEKSQDVKIKVAVDLFSRQLISIEYPEAMRTENYSGYGLKNNETLPSHPISMTELQNRIQQMMLEQQKAPDKKSN